MKYIVLEIFSYVWTLDSFKPLNRCLQWGSSYLKLWSCDYALKPKWGCLTDEGFQNNFSCTCYSLKYRSWVRLKKRSNNSALAFGSFGSTQQWLNIWIVKIFKPPFDNQSLTFTTALILYGSCVCNNENFLIRSNWCHCDSSYLQRPSHIVEGDRLNPWVQNLEDFIYKTFISQLWNAFE